MTERRQVHITNEDGRLLYTRLWDDGSNALCFDSGYGFVDRLDVQRYRWTINSGWPPTSAERDRFLKALEREEQKFDELYGDRADEVRGLINSAIEAEERFEPDELERYAEQLRKESR